MLHNRQFPPDIIPRLRRPPVATALAIIGFHSTSLTIVLSVIPAEDEPYKLLAVPRSSSPLPSSPESGLLSSSGRSDQEKSSGTKPRSLAV
jgi:hypothetical protein